MRTRAVMRLRLPESAPRLSAVQPATYHPRQRQYSTVWRNIPAFQAETTHKNVEVVRVVSMTVGSGFSLKVNAASGERPDCRKMGRKSASPGKRRQSARRPVGAQGRDERAS